MLGRPVETRYFPGQEMQNKTKSQILNAPPVATVHVKRHSTHWKDATCDPGLLLL